MASPSPSREANAQTLSEPLENCENAATPASENDAAVDDASSKFFRFLALPAELRQKILGQVVGFCSLDSTTAEAMAQLPKDPVAKLEALEESDMLSDKDKKAYSTLRPLFGICSTIREDMTFVERAWLKNRGMNLSEFEHWLDNRTEIDSIALSINDESFLRSPPPGYEALVKQHNLDIASGDTERERPLERGYYKRWATAIRRLPVRHFSYIELHSLEEKHVQTWWERRSARFPGHVADRFQTYLMIRTRSRKLSSVVVIGDRRENRG